MNGTFMAYRARRPPGRPGDGAITSARLAYRCERGAVTAAFATVLPAVMVVALLLLSWVRLVGVSIGCQDAASAAARAAIASGDETDPSSAARAVVGKGVAVNINMTERQVTVVTRCPVIPDPGGVLPTVVEGKAVGVLS